MQYVIIHHFTKSGITESMMQPHVEYLRKLHDQGKLLITGPFLDEKGGGMFMIEVQNEEEMRQIVSNDPAVTSGLSRSEVRPYKVVFGKITP